MLMLLGSLAHNVVTWVQHWLAAATARLQHYGPLRMVRDIFHVSGFLLVDAWGGIRQIVLNQLAPEASVLLGPFQALGIRVAISLGQT